MSSGLFGDTSLPRPRVQGGSVLYLDFDGVLHPNDVWVRPRGGPYVRSPHGRRLFENAELLVDLLDAHPTVRIVLSTSWVCRFGFARTTSFLPAGLASRCIGATFHAQMGRNWFEQQLRGAQVHADLRRRNPSTWLAVDDCDEGWDEMSAGSVVLCDPVDGIAAPKVLAALRTALERFQR